ncbi:eukaryotic aspartyl protease family protein isoform X2 [Wolffia australiana]
MVWCSLERGASFMQDKVLSMYHPRTSSSSKHLPCSHELCSSVSSTCDSPSQPCHYSVNYYSENTSSSGLLMQDTLYLASSDSSALIRASVIIGCGSKQSGGYLDGIAPDGLLGLGLGKISVPSILAREGLVRDSFSLCFEEDDSGRLLFGDQGVSGQQSTPFVAVEGRYPTYIVQVEGWCIGAECLGQTATKALVDSGSSFTYLPGAVFEAVVAEFDRQMNRSSITYEGSPFQLCYKASSLEMAEVPRVKLMLAVNQSFSVNSPLFLFYSHEGQREALCLAVQPSDDPHITIGQNFMTGYRMVFDRERMRLAWSPSSQCEDPVSSRHAAIPPPADWPTNPLPTAGGPPGAATINPALAGHAPRTGQAVPPPSTFRFCFLPLLLLLLAFSVVVYTG